MAKKCEDTFFIEFKEKIDQRGSLVPLEVNDDIPFEIKRVYYIFNVKENRPRGFHAHKNLEQVMICMQGSCEIVLDNGVRKKSIVLNRPIEGLYVPKMVWREMHNFSKDCILLVLASDTYNEIDYIRSYDEFLNEVRKHE